MNQIVYYVKEWPFNSHGPFNFYEDAVSFIEKHKSGVTDCCYIEKVNK